MAAERTGIEKRIKSAIKRGLNASEWVKQEIEKGRSYRRSIMYSDWREVASIIKAESALERIRTGRIPIDRMAELKAWNMSREYMYKVRSETVTARGRVLEPKFVNIMSDEPMTVEEIETAAFELAFEQSPPESGQERRFIFETGYKRVIE